MGLKMKITPASGLHVRAMVSRIGSVIPAIPSLLPHRKNGIMTPVTSRLSFMIKTKRNGDFGITGVVAVRSKSVSRGMTVKIWAFHCEVSRRPSSFVGRLKMQFIPIF